MKYGIFLCKTASFIAQRLDCVLPRRPQRRIDHANQTTRQSAWRREQDSLDFHLKDLLKDLPGLKTCRAVTGGVHHARSKFIFSP